MELGLKNKIAIVTGGGTGIGLKTAELLLNEGAKVVINGRREDVLKDALKKLDPSGKNTAYVAGDIADPVTSKQLAAQTVNTFGGIDILINNTGKFGPKPFMEYTPADTQSYFDTIVKGTLYPAQAVTPEMKKRGKGAIVNTGSIWAIQAIEPTPSTAYSAAMAGRHALTRNLAVELASDQIRVNAVAPAVVETPIYNTFLPDNEVPKVLEGFNSFHPLGRNGQPVDVANVIVYLASDAASWITGTILPVDGGATARLR